MILSELFDQPTVFKFTKKSKSGAVVKFDVEGIPYTVEMSIISDSIVSHMANTGRYPFSVGDAVLEIDFTAGRGKKETFRATGTGNQYLVFSTVMSAVESYLEYRGGIDWLALDAVTSEPSRIKLYRRLARRLGETVEVQRPMSVTFCVKVG